MNLDDDDDDDDIPLARLPRTAAARRAKEKTTLKRNSVATEENLSPNMVGGRTVKGKPRKMKSVKQEK